MNERNIYCNKLKLGSCCGCVNLDLVKSEHMANPDVEVDMVLKWVGESACPPGERPLPVFDVKKISSDRFIRG